MNFRDYYLGLTPEQREDYATRAGTTLSYMPQLINERPYKVPKPELMRGLAEASNGALTLEDVLMHFYGEPRVTGPRRLASQDDGERTGNEKKAAAG